MCLKSEKEKLYDKVLIFERVIEKILYFSCKFYKVFIVNIGMNVFIFMICYLEIINY